MPEWLAVLLFIAGYWVVMKWILPKFGVPTCMAGTCSVGSRRLSLNSQTTRLPGEAAAAGLSQKKAINRKQSK